MALVYTEQLENEWDIKPFKRCPIARYLEQIRTTKNVSYIDIINACKRRNMLW